MNSKSFIRRHNACRWLPFFISLILGALTLVLYRIFTPAPLALSYLKITVCAFLPLIFPLLEKIIDTPLSVPLNLLLCSHIVFSVYLGTGAGFYSFISWWDLFLHGYFGVVGAFFIDYFLSLTGGENLGVGARYFIIFLSVMGFAGLWEVFEFTTDIIFSQDAQGVISAIKNGTSPIKDTMTDIIITALGFLVFLLTKLIYSHHKKDSLA